MSALSRFPLAAGDKAYAADVEQVRKNDLLIFTYGEALTAGNAVYLKASDGKIYKTDATTAGEACYGFIGFVLQSGSTDDTGAVSRNYSGDQSGLTINADYFLTNTGGAISTTPGTNIVYAGRAITTTAILRDYDMGQPIAGSSAVSVSATGTSATADDSTVLTLVLPRACRVLLLFSGAESGSSNAQSQQATISFNVDAGTIIQGSTTSWQPSFTFQLGASVSAVSALLAAGSHTFKMRMVVASSSSMTRSIAGTLYAIPLT